MVVGREYIRQCALEAGFSLCGVARCRSMGEQLARLEEWLARGYGSGLEYMGRNMEKRGDPAVLIEGAGTVIVCAVNYKNEFWDQEIRGEDVKIASHALARDYHTTIKEMLHSVLRRLKEASPGVGGRCFSDSAPMFEKAWAVEAGLGWIGKNSLLVTPEYGSFVLLGEIIINAAADSYDPPFAGERCGDCTECIKRCPGQAIRNGRVIDTRRCISRITIEKIPEGSPVGTTDTHGWLFGCDVCQSCCPYNADSPMHTLPAFDPVVGRTEMEREFGENMTRESFDGIFGQTPLSRTGYHALRERLDKMREKR